MLGLISACRLFRFLLGIGDFQGGTWPTSGAAEKARSLKRSLLGAYSVRPGLVTISEPMLLLCTISHPSCFRAAGSTSCAGLGAPHLAACAAAVQRLDLGRHGTCWYPAMDCRDLNRDFLETRVSVLVYIKPGFSFTVR